MIELMIVVAIIGILAAIAIPSYKRHQRKAKQNEARTHLAHIWLAQKSFHGEWNQYFSNMAVTGYRAEGPMVYNIGFVTNDVWSDGAAPANYYMAAGPANAHNTRAGCGTAFPNCTDISGGSVPGTPTGATDPNNGTGKSAQFVVSAEGDIGGPVNDIWTINEAKDLLNAQDGL